MRIFDLMLKDLSQITRDKKSFLFLLAMPVIFTLFMGFAYKGGPSQNEDNRIAVAWINNDQNGMLSQTLYETLQTSDAIKLVLLENTDPAQALSKGEVAGVLIVPVGFSQQAMSGERVQLTLLTDPNSTTGQSIFQALRNPVSQLMSSVEIAVLSAESVGKPGDMAEMTTAFEQASQSWKDASSGVTLQVEKATGVKQYDPYGGNPYNQASPGILVQFAIFSLVVSAQMLVQERKTHTLQRMLTTSMRPWEIVAGHLLAMFAVVMTQEILLIVFGQLVLGVNYSSATFGTLLMAMALGLWVSTMGLLIGVFAKGEEQVILFSLMAMFLFSALGGTWFPLEVAGKAFITVGRLTPSAWAMTGFQNILIRGQGLESVWLPAGILLAFAAGFFALAVWGFRKIESQ
jgi:ABC-2 type transport system permease protein